MGLLLADSSSYVNLYPDWRPTKPTQHGVFGLREMIASGICLERAGTESAEQPVAAEQHVLCRHDTGDRRSETHPPLARHRGREEQATDHAVAFLALHDSRSGLRRLRATVFYFVAGAPGIAGMPAMAIFVVHSAAAEVALVMASASPLFALAMS